MKTTIRERFSQHWHAHRKDYLWNAVLALVVLFGVQAWQTRHVPSGLAPDLAIQVLRADGGVDSTTLQQWRAQHPGEPVALHFWAEWCPICRTEQHSVSRVARDWPVLSVAMQSGNAEDVGKVLHERQLPWATVIDQSGEVTRRHGFQSVPAFVVIDADGVMRTPTAGYTSELGMRLRLWWAGIFGSSK